MLLDSFQFHARMREFHNVTVAFSLDVDALASIALLRLFFRMHHIPFSMYPIYTDSHLLSFLGKLSQMTSLTTEPIDRVVMLINIGATQDLAQYDSLHIYIVDYLRPASLTNVASQHVFLFDEGLILGSLLLSFFPQKAARVLHEAMLCIHSDKVKERENAPHSQKDEEDSTTTIDTKSYRRVRQEYKEWEQPNHIYHTQDQSLSEDQDTETSESIGAPQHHPFDGSDTDSMNIPMAPSHSGGLGLLLDDPINQGISPHDEPEYSDSVNKESTEESVHSSLQDGTKLSFISDDTHLTDVSMGATHRHVDTLLKEAKIRSHESKGHFDTSFNAQVHSFDYLDTTRHSGSQGASGEDDKQDPVAAAFALLQERATSMSSMTELATLRVLYCKLSVEDINHIYRILSNTLSHPSSTQVAMTAEYMKLRAVASPSAVLLYDILSEEAKTGLFMSRSLMVSIQWHAMTGAAGAFIMQRCSLNTVKELLISCMNTLQLKEKQFTNTLSVSQYTTGAKSLSLEEVIANSQRNNSLDIQVATPRFTVHSDPEPSAGSVVGSTAGNEDSLHSILSQSSRLSSLLNTNDTGPAFTKSMQTSLPLHDPLPYVVINDPFLYCLRMTSLYNALSFTNSSLLRGVFDSYVSNRKSLQTVTTTNMVSFFCNINGFGPDLYQKSWSEQDNNARSFILSRYTASVRKTSAPWRSIPFVPNMVYTTETNVEISAFDTAYLLEGLMMLLPPNHTNVLDRVEFENSKNGNNNSIQVPLVVCDELTHSQLLMMMYKCAFAGPDEILEVSNTRKFVAIFQRILDNRSEVLHHAQKSYLFYRQRYRKIDPIPGVHVSELPMASLNHSLLYLNKIVTEFRLLCVHRHLQSLSRSPISFRFRYGHKDLQMILPSVSSRDAARWRKYTNISPKQDFEDTLQRQSVVLVFKGPDYALASGASTRLSLFDAWLANSLPPIKEILTKKGAFTESCVEHSVSVVAVPLQMTFTILPVIKGFMAANLEMENAKIKKMLDHKESLKRKQGVDADNEDEQDKQESEADDICIDANTSK
ncbi:Hypothetical protein GLP15_5098 [Giardia lamblia P15]|uniref:CDC45-like protein n=1 Tax=Giardia intestinalis (strain P15) TaxID=658858 RepID=E1EYI3_GIAIA|nr:Hypothetical protein GLP15_5098 [Giardia lamblia P15]